MYNNYDVDLIFAYNEYCIKNCFYDDIIYLMCDEVLDSYKENTIMNKLINDEYFIQWYENR